MTPSDYLKRPYGRVVTPDSDGSFRGEIIEFPGCFSTGETPEEALVNLEAAAESWIEASLERGTKIREPLEGAEGFSGKLMLRIAKSLHKQAAHLASREGVSLNQLIQNCLVECVSRSSVERSAARLIVHNSQIPTQGLAASAIVNVDSIDSQRWIATRTSDRTLESIEYRPISHERVRNA